MTVLFDASGMRRVAILSRGERMQWSHPASTKNAAEIQQIVTKPSSTIHVTVTHNRCCLW